MMKKKFLVLLCFFLLLCLTGCGKTQSNEKEEDTQEEVKYNLNDNIEVVIMTESTGLSECFFNMFATNLSDVFPQAQIESDGDYHYVTYWSGSADDRAEGEIAEDDLIDNLESLKFNTEKENNIVNLFKEYQQKEYFGLNNVTYKLENHRFMYSYNYLVFKDESIKTDGEEFNEKVNKALEESIRFNGPCDGFDFAKEEILNEELCNEYNLTCDRW